MAFVAKACNRLPVTAVDAVAVTKVFDWRPSRFVSASHYFV